MRHTEIHVTIANRHYAVSPAVSAQIETILKQSHARALCHEEQEWVSAKELFPDLNDPIKRPANYLRGMRLREGLTQTQLAAKVGILQHHISEMERYKRPIGKVAAKKLAAALNANWRNML